MSFDQRPARATRRIVEEAKPQPGLSTAPAVDLEPRPKTKAHTTLFIVGALVGGLATTALINGIVPGIPAITLPKVLS